MWSVSCRRLGCPRSARIFSGSRTEMGAGRVGCAGDERQGWGMGMASESTTAGAKDPLLVVGHLGEHVTPLRSVTGLVGAHPIHLVYRSRPRGGGVHARVGRLRLFLVGAGLIDGGVPQEYPGDRGGEEVGFGANAAADPRVGGADPA